MVEVGEYFLRLQTALGKKNAEGRSSSDKIDEALWRNEVMEELNQAHLTLKTSCKKRLERSMVSIV